MDILDPTIDVLDEDEAEEAISEGMSEEEYSGAVKAAITDAVDYIDSNIAPQRELAEQYYRGDPFGNEEEGRSQVVMTEVRDVVLAMMPSLLRVFTASEKPVEFVPKAAGKEAQAEQATDYVSYVFMEDNPGFTILHSSFKDALKSKMGIFKWYTDVKTEVVEEIYSGIGQASVNVLSEDSSVEIVQVLPTGVGDPDPMTGEPTQFFDVLLRRHTDRKRQVVECVPPEEFIIARNARDIDSADYVGHRSLKTLSELVAMGYEREDIEEHGGGGASTFKINTEAVTRNPALNNTLRGGSSDSTDPAMSRYEYIESYMRIDKDGDGIAELRRICTIGEACYILFDEVVDEIKFATICPDPEPHMAIGSSMADQVMDLQLIKSNIFRNTLDSLAQTIHPRTAYVEGQVNVDDLMNVETGGLVRMTQPGMIQELGSTFVGQQAMPVLGYIDDIRSSRTGMSKASQGLDPDVLQSTTKAAVTATMSAAQERLEMVARIFAETGIKRLFKGLLKEIIRHQDRPRMIRLRNSWVEIDPRAWDADMDVVVNVGLGSGSIDQKIQALGAILAQQKEAMQMLGPGNQIVTFKHIRNTIAQMIELQGFKDVTKYFGEITPEIEQQMTQPPQPQPDPNMVLAQAEASKAQVEAQKVQKDIEVAGMRAQLDAASQKASDDLERDKLDVEIYFRAKEYEAKYGIPIPVEEVYAMVQRNRDVAAVMPPPQSPEPAMGYQ